MSINITLWKNALPKTNISPLEIGQAPKENDRIPTIHFRGAKMLVSERVHVSQTAKQVWENNKSSPNSKSKMDLECFFRQKKVWFQQKRYSSDVLIESCG